MSQATLASTRTNWSSSSAKRQRGVTKKARTARVPTQVRIGKQTFPKQLFNTLTYCEEVSFNAAAAVGKGAYLWSCNGCYDPNITGAGHQPQYFDQMTAIYDHYTVLRSRIHVWLSYGTSGVNNGVVAALYIDDDTAVKGDALTAAEMPGAVSKMFVPAVDGVCYMKHNWDAAKTFGPNPQAQDSLQGTSSSNPTEQSYYSLQTYDLGLSANTIFAFVKIEYDVVWDEITTIGAS